ncbi:MAG: response regulator [Elusimicrobiota bacterium]
MKNLLVVENMDTLRELVYDELTEAGYKTVAAHSVAEGRELVKYFTPDLALLDIKLPGESGVEFAKELKKQWPKLPVIFCTAYYDKDTMKEIGDTEVADFFLKPFDLDVLKQRIKELIG